MNWSSPMTTDHMAWFREAKFGMFIHWGLYALLGRDAGDQHAEAIPAAEYDPLADRFFPAADCARQWAALAKRAGAQYVVLVSKHHDGFCLFDSQLTDFTSTRHGARRDYVREVVEAVRAEGLRVGLYYSLPDWHNPAYLEVADGNPARQQELQAYLHGHVRELLSNYGKIDLLWYDGPAYAAPIYGETGYLPPEIIDAAGMNALARELQPEILINDRSMLPEDYTTPENECTPAPPGRDWEMCTCINDLWGYNPHDYNYKTLNQLIFLLVSCAVQGGNLLLNIGPRPDGSVPEQQVSRMEALGDWLKIHGESIYGVERLPDCFFNSGRVTRKGQRLYFHTFYWPGSTLRLPRLSADTLQGAPGKARVQAQVLTTGQPAQARWEGDMLLITDLPADPPDQADTVVAVDVL
ncbi:MAG: alpha-L-fucosidase [Armatimonadota bacterium]